MEVKYLSRLMLAAVTATYILGCSKPAPVTNTKAPEGKWTTVTGFSVSTGNDAITIDVPKLPARLILEDGKKACKLGAQSPGSGGFVQYDLNPDSQVEKTIPLYKTGSWQFTGETFQQKVLLQVQG